MPSHIILDNKKVEYTLKLSRRARNLRLAIFCDGNFVVTAPPNISANIIEQFIVAKSRWILDKLEHFKGMGDKTFIYGSKREYLKHREAARELARERVVHFNLALGYPVSRIFIKNQKTRWGSCSKKGNLNFNYKIALLPPRLADYLIVHELCHLKEFNHSANFWRLVGEVLPDYQACRRELRNYRLVCN